MADIKTASVLAFERKLDPSDALFFSGKWEQRDDSYKWPPITIREKAVRGTISNRLKGKDSDPAKLDAAIENPNLQRVDVATLPNDCDTLKVRFTLRVLGGAGSPSACNNSAYREKLNQIVQGYVNETGFGELSMRYACNLANGRFLWRNRVGVEQLEIHVKISNAAKKWVFDGTQISTQHFDDISDDIVDLGTHIADALSGKVKFLLLEVSAYAQIGHAQDVYPSEELVLDKGNSKSKKSKILYHVKNVAALHSQKIGNALRSIDTWYPEFSEHGKPIAIEPYGAVTNLGRAFRTPKEKVDFFSLFDKFARGRQLENKEAEHYVMAVLVRGGVFGESEKE